jgi:hypothetical protein
MIKIWKKLMFFFCFEDAKAALNPTLALVSVCGDISPSLQVMNLEFLQ